MPINRPGSPPVDPLPDHPSVDVVIPARDVEPYLAESVRSVLRQSLPARRVHVVENCSRDATVRVAERLVREDPRVNLVRASRCGEGAARNRGLAEASDADLIALLDADDVWEPTFLEETVATLRVSPPETGVAHTEYRLIDASGRPLSGRRRRATRSGDIYLPLLLDGYAVTASASGALLRRDVLEDGVRFDEDLDFAADWEFWLRIARRWRFAPVRRPLVAIRIREGSVQTTRRGDAGNALRCLATELEIMRRHRDAVEADELADAMRRRILIRGFALRRRPAALARFLRHAPAVLRRAEEGRPQLIRHLIRDLRRLAGSL